MSRRTELGQASEQVPTPDSTADQTSLSQVLNRITRAAASARWLVVGASTENALPGDLKPTRLSFRDWQMRGSEPSASQSSAFDAILLFAPTSSTPAEHLATAAQMLSDDGKLIVVTAPTRADCPESDSYPDTLTQFEASALESGFRLQRNVVLEAALETAQSHDLPTPTAGTEATGEPPLRRAMVLYRDGFRLRKCADSDIEQILTLFERSFYHHRPEEHWRWKYQANPWGNEKITIIERTPSTESRRAETPGIEEADSEVSLVGQYCAYPVPWIRHDTQAGTRRMLCHQVGDTMTAREVRSVGRGPTSLLARAARHFYARHCHGQVAFNYGFNTGNIREFSKRFVGALDVMPAPYRVLPLPRAETRESWNPDRSIVQRIKDRLTGSSSSVEVRRVETLDERFDQLVDLSLSQYRLLVERSSSYLGWRYLAAPDAEYKLYAAFDEERLLGWGVFRQREDELVWGDALFEEADGGRMAAAAILDHAIAEADGATRVVAWFNPHPAWWDRWLVKAGFAAEPEPNDLAMVVVPFEWADPVPTLEADLYLTMGDSDLF